jgi:hypothetical protein
VELHTAKWEPSSGWSVPLPACDGPNTLVLAFAATAVQDQPSPIQDLGAAFPRSAVIGCSTAGEIMADTVSDGSLVAAVARFDSTRITLAHERVPAPGHSYDAGLTLGKQLGGREPDLAAVFTLADGLGVNGTPLVAGLLDGTGGDAVITGGLAGDGERFRHTWVLVDGEPRSGYVSAVGLAGDEFRVGHGSRGGWETFGPQRRVTRSEGNVLFELDGQPALELYKKYLGDRAAGLPATALLFPLAVWAPGSDKRQLVRTILSIDEATQSMTFAGDVPQGSQAQLMRASLDRIVDAARVAADDSATTPGAGALAVAVSCVGRRLLLGGRTEDELEATLGGLPADAALVGFYSYGEISPILARTCDLHNQTMTVATFWEADG